jgi:hypothetical protein
VPSASAGERGPGLTAPITLRGPGEPGTEAELAELASQAGLFAAMFGQVDQGQLLADRPSGDLGPRYTVTYTIPVDQGSVEVTQDLYPYARGGPVTSTRPGQQLWAGQEVAGGWFRGPATFKAMLTSLGLPKRAPAGGPTAAPAAKDVPAAKAKPVPQQAEVAVAAAAASASRPDAGSPALWWAGAALLGGALAGGLALVTLRRRRA